MNDIPENQGFPDWAALVDFVTLSRSFAGVLSGVLILAAFRPVGVAMLRHVAGDCHDPVAAPRRERMAGGAGPSCVRVRTLNLGEDSHASLGFSAKDS